MGGGTDIAVESADVIGRHRALYPVWAMVAMAVSVTTIFVNSLGGWPSLLFEAIGSVGRGRSRP